MAKRHVALIPARMGSQRLKRKNLELFSGVPLIEYAVQRCLASHVFDEIYINSEDLVFSEIAERNGVSFYHRSADLANHVATSEDFIADFFENTDCDTIYQVHSITPLLAPDIIRDFVNFCDASDYDTVLSNVDDQIEVAYQGSPVNFSFSQKTNSQDLLPVQRITWSISFWTREPFLSAHRSASNGTYSGKVGFFSVPLYSGLAIKTLLDLKVAEALKEVGVV